MSPRELQRMRWRDRHWKARRRKWQAASARAGVCQRPRQGGGVCGGELRGPGLDCVRCARRDRGICQHCPAPVAGRVGFAMYCAPHRAAVFAAQNQRSAERCRRRAATTRAAA